MTDRCIADDYQAALDEFYADATRWDDVEEILCATGQDFQVEPSYPYGDVIVLHAGGRYGLCPVNTNEPADVLAARFLERLARDVEANS